MTDTYLQTFEIGVLLYILSHDNYKMNYFCKRTRLGILSAPIPCPKMLDSIAGQQQQQQMFVLIYSLKVQER